MDLGENVFILDSGKRILINYECLALAFCQDEMA